MKTLLELQAGLSDINIVYGGNYDNEASPLPVQYVRFAAALSELLDDDRIKAAVYGVGALPAASSQSARDNFGKRQEIYQDLRSTLHKAMQGTVLPTFRNDTRTEVDKLIKIAQVFQPNDFSMPETNDMQIRLLRLQARVDGLEMRLADLEG